MVSFEEYENRVNTHQKRFDSGNNIITLGTYFLIASLLAVGSDFGYRLSNETSANHLTVGQDPLLAFSVDNVIPGVAIGGYGLLRRRNARNNLVALEKIYPEYTQQLAQKRNLPKIN